MNRYALPVPAPVSQKYDHYYPLRCLSNSFFFAVAATFPEFPPTPEYRIAPDGKSPASVGKAPVSLGRLRALGLPMLLVFFEECTRNAPIYYTY